MCLLRRGCTSRFSSCGTLSSIYDGISIDSKFPSIIVRDCKGGIEGSRRSNNSGVCQQIWDVIDEKNLCRRTDVVSEVVPELAAIIDEEYTRSFGKALSHFHSSLLGPALRPAVIMQFQSCIAIKR
jgi:hypothetical protein